MNRYDFGMSDYKSIFDGSRSEIYSWPTDAQIRIAAFRETVRENVPLCVGIVLSLVGLLIISPSSGLMLVFFISCGVLQGIFLRRMSE